MRLLFVHYSFGDDGVTRSALNTIKGLKEISGEFEFTMLADSFSPSLPDYIEKQKINWNSLDLISELELASKSADFVIIENPTVGIFPQATKAFKEFTEKNQNKKIIYRMHDFIDDRPYLFDEFSKFFDNLSDIYPDTDNVTFLVLNSYDQSRLKRKGIKEVQVMPNSIVTRELLPDEEKAKELRKTLEEDNILKPEEKILLYPVRVLKRKNLEEAIMLTKIISETGNYRLIVTLPFEEDYGEEMKAFADSQGVKCSIGEVGKYIGFDKNSGFTISELYAISEFVISTSVREGFGFVFLEPWIAGTPLIGRKIPLITQDFENNGINFSHMYDNSLLYTGENHSFRMEKINEILSAEKKLSELSNALNLQENMKKASEVINHNREAIRENYDYQNVAKKFMELLKPEIPVNSNLN